MNDTRWAMMTHHSDVDHEGQKVNRGKAQVVARRVAEIDQWATRPRRPAMRMHAGRPVLKCVMGVAQTRGEPQRHLARHTARVRVAQSR